MSDLFMRRSAIISACGKFRPELRRVWDDSKPLLPVCMLNPSRGDHTIDDPTILTLIWFAKLWGYGGLLLKAHRTNLDSFAWKTGRLAIGVFDDDRAGGPVEILWAEGPTG
jgi:hypothetical protein